MPRQPKPNTMDDLRALKRFIYDILLEWTDFDPDGQISFVIDSKFSEVEALITAKLQEVDRAARIDTLERLVPHTERQQILAGNTKTFDKKPIYRWVDYVPIEVIDTNLASLKGGDV